MWTAQDTVNALHAAKAVILRNWQADAKKRLWHVDRAQFNRNGVFLQSAARTLDALIGFHQARAARPALPETTDSAALPSEADTAAVEAEVVPLLSILPNQGLLAREWSAAPTWSDFRLMLELLASHIRQALHERGADADTLALGDGALETLVAAVADRRVASLEQQVATHNEETVVTQHLAGRFLANASHELRTPLTAVLGFAELLLEETYGDLTPEQRTAISHIENSAQNLLEIVNNLLDLLHIRAGKLSLQYRPIEIIPLFRHLYEILSPLANRKRVELSMDLAEDLGTMEADGNIVRHIVYHLLSIAIRATPAEGQVRLEVRRGSNSLIIITRDTALHLPPEALANMMDAFPILENSPARGYEGWEVGLPLVQRYVDLYGGTMEMENLPQQGTVFRIVLPATHPPDTT